MTLETGQAVNNAAGHARHPEQVFVQGLFELAIGVRVGKQRMLTITLYPLARLGRQTGVVVIAQHQAHASQMHDIGVVQPITTTGLGLQCQQAIGELGSLRPPFGPSHRQPMFELPKNLDLLDSGWAAALIPLVGDALDQVVQHRRIEADRLLAQPLLFCVVALIPTGQCGQTVVTDHKPGNGSRQRRKLFEGRGRRGIEPIALITACRQPTAVILVSGRRQPPQPAGIIIRTNERQEQTQ